MLTLTGSSEGKTFTLNGTVSVSCSLTTSSASKVCASGYADIHSGAQVEIFNERNEILTTGSLRMRQPPTAMTPSASSTRARSYYDTMGAVVTIYSFTIPDVPRGAKQYGVHVGNSNRGIIWADEKQASSIGFLLSIGG